MNSLRAQLAVGLSLVFLLLLAAGGAALYVSTRAVLLREFDASLRVRANSLAAFTEYENGNVTVDLADKTMPEFERGPHAAYFQMWLVDGTTLRRSPSLGTADLPAHLADEPNLTFSSITLPEGTPGRAIGLRFHPHVSDEPNRTESLSSPLVVLVVAKERTDMNRHLRLLATGLFVIGMLVMGGSVVLTAMVIRRVLAPLSQLTEQASTITAATLGSRLPRDGLPSELLPVADRLNDLLARLEQSFERERRFTSDAAHELRTPIAELRALAEVALKWPEDKDATADGFRDALAVAQKMERLVAGLLTLTRSDTGRQSLACEPVALAPLVDETWLPFAESVRRKQITTTLDIPGSLALHTDRTLLRLIITNLFANAAEYTPRDGVVRIHAVRHDNAFTLTVANTVTDLTANDLPHLFERFWRKDPARSAAQHSGLGLALAKSCADALGMSLTAAMLDSHTLTVLLTGTHAGDNSSSESEAIANLSSVDGAATRG